MTSSLASHDAVRSAGHSGGAMSSRVSHVDRLRLPIFMSEPPQASPTSRAPSVRGAPGLRAAVLFVVVAAFIIVPFLLWGTPVEQMSREFLGKAGERPLFSAIVLSGLLAIDPVAPVPSSVVGTACGVVLGFSGGTLAAFGGMTVGSAIGYWLGWVCRTPALRLTGNADMRRLEQWHARWGVWLLAALRPVPVLAEASLVFAGLTRMPLRRAAPVLLLSNLGVAAVYAAIGAWAAQTQTFLLAFLGSVALPGVGLLLFRRREPPSHETPA